MKIIVARWYEDFPCELVEMEVQSRAISPNTFSLTVEGREYVINKSLLLLAMKEIGVVEQVQNG